MRWPWVSQRVLEPELMDDPGLDPDRHARALRGLSRLNAMSGSVGLVWPVIARLAGQHPRPLRVLDVATGAGDIPLGLWRRAQRAGLVLEVLGVDVSRRAVCWANARAEREAATVRFEVLDVLAEPWPTDYDVVISSLFLHHLTAGQAVRLLTSMKRAAGSLLVINDLVRCTGGLLLAHAAARLFTTSGVVHTDAALSVRSAFTVAEARQLALDAGLSGVEVQRCWPFRMLMTWSPA